jgi:hypothetical protein
MLITNQNYQLLPFLKVRRLMEHSIENFTMKQNHKQHFYVSITLPRTRKNQ